MRSRAGTKKNERIFPIQNPRAQPLRYVNFFDDHRTVEKQGIGLVTYPAGRVQVMSHGHVHVRVGRRWTSKEHPFHRHVLRWW